MDKETADKIRGMVRRVPLKNIRDTGEMQTASVEVADGIWRDDVEIMQPYGFASHVPEDGALGWCWPSAETRAISSSCRSPIPPNAWAG